MVGRINPDIIVMCGAGVQTPDDVAQMMALGVGGTGSSSGVLKAADPIAKMRAMLAAMKQAWMNAHPEDDPDARPSATLPLPGRTPGTRHSRGPIG
jgi:thiazole synthase ThiGH ThiG subunit